MKSLKLIASILIFSCQAANAGNGADKIGQACLEHKLKLSLCNTANDIKKNVEQKIGNIELGELESTSLMLAYYSAKFGSGQKIRVSGDWILNSDTELTISKEEFFLNMSWELD